MTAVAVAAGVVGKSPHRAQAVDTVVGMRIARGPAAGRKAAFAAAWAAASIGWAVASVAASAADRAAGIDSVVVLAAVVVGQQGDPCVESFGVGRHSHIAAAEVGIGFVQKPELGVGKTPGFDSLVSAHSRPSRCSLTVVRAELNFWSAGGWFYEMVGGGGRVSTWFLVKEGGFSGILPLFRLNWCFKE